MREGSPSGGPRRGRGGRGMGRGSGRVELEEGWRNRNIQRSRSGDRQLAGTSSGTGVKIEPYENASKGKSGEKREENTGKSEMEKLFVDNLDILDWRESPRNPRLDLYQAVSQWMMSTVVDLKKL